MQCTLLIPHLFPPGGFGDDLCRDLALDNLRKFLARSHHLSFDAIDATGWLCQAFEVEKQLDWPVAPLTLTVDGGEANDAYWLRADPVHLQARRDQLQLADGNMLKVSKQEADELVATLNHHFADHGMVFLAPHPGRWYLRLAHRPEITTHAPGSVAGGNINALLPAGRDALNWHGIVNEIQMLLHEHAVNEARETRNEMAINSVWLWGGGAKTAVPGRHFSAVWSDNALATALAAGADIHAAALPDHAGRWLRAAGAAPASGNVHHLIVLEQLDAAAQYGNAGQWRENIAALDRDWLAPLLQALQQRRISRIALVAPGGRRCQRFEATPLDLLKFWRKTRPLSAYAT
ncbi:MAG: phosphoglycerate mutase [Pseudomonadota bacterium]|mgnify:CR=1 FL=1